MDMYYAKAHMRAHQNEAENRRLPKEARQIRPHDDVRPTQGSPLTAAWQRLTTRVTQTSAKSAVSQAPHCVN